MNKLDVNERVQEEESDKHFSKPVDGKNECCQITLMMAQIRSDYGAHLMAKMITHTHTHVRLNQILNQPLC